MMMISTPHTGIGILEHPRHEFWILANRQGWLLEGWLLEGSFFGNPLHSASVADRGRRFRVKGG